MVESISVRTLLIVFFLFFFFKQKTAYEMRISDWSSDVCSSDLDFPQGGADLVDGGHPWQCRADQLFVGQVGARRDDQDDEQGMGPLQGVRELRRLREIGRASCRERVCQYV